MRIVFAGTPEFAARSLRALLAHSYNVVAVYTQPDRPSGRGMKCIPSPVKQIATAAGIAVCQPEHFKDPQTLETLAHWGADMMIVAAYGLLLPKSVLELPTCGCVNIHASLLPRWRGAAPIIRAIEAGDRETGITMMQMDAGLDTGPILLTQPCPITGQETGGSLHEKLADLGAQTCMAFLAAFAKDKLQAQAQNSALATYAAKIRKDEAQIDWTQTAAEIERKIRAFNPWPVAFTQFAEQRWRVWNSRVAADAVRATPGEVLCADKSGIDVACGEGVLRLLELQRPGGKPQAAAVFMHACPIRAGQRLLPSATISGETGGGN